MVEGVGGGGGGWGVCVVWKGRAGTEVETIAYTLSLRDALRIQTKKEVGSIPGMRTKLGA